MFGPKHTAREAAAILIAGLKDGSIVLRRPDEAPAKADGVNGYRDPYLKQDQSPFQKPTAKKTG
jgi:hypothetical protein